MGQVKIKVTPSGATTVEAEGFKGTSCEDATKAFREALGQVEDDQKKPEFYESVTEDETVEAGQ
jgi:hypothetical protein